MLGYVRKGGRVEQWVQPERALLVGGSVRASVQVTMAVGQLKGPSWLSTGWGRSEANEAADAHGQRERAWRVPQTTPGLHRPKICPC